MPISIFVILHRDNIDKEKQFLKEHRDDFHVHVSPSEESVTGGARGGVNGNREPNKVSAASVSREQTPSIFRCIPPESELLVSQSDMEITSLLGDVIDLRADVISDVIVLRADVVDDVIDLRADVIGEVAAFPEIEAFDIFWAEVMGEVPVFCTAAVFLFFVVDFAGETFCDFFFFSFFSVLSELSN